MRIFLFFMRNNEKFSNRIKKPSFCEKDPEVFPESKKNRKREGKKGFAAEKTGKKLETEVP